MYLEELKEPKELINQCITRSRDRYQREYDKLLAHQHHQKFFTDEGVKDRAQSLKFKMLMKTRHPECKSDKDLKEMDVKEKALAMLILHNQKVDKI